METTLTNVNAYENAVRTQAGAADIRAQLLDSLAKSKAVVDSVFGKIEEIDRMKAESEQLRKKISSFRGNCDGAAVSDSGDSVCGTVVSGAEVSGGLVSGSCVCGNSVSGI